MREQATSSGPGREITETFAVPSMTIRVGRTQRFVFIFPYL